MSKNKKRLDGLLAGVENDPPSDKMLRNSYWELVSGYRVASCDWTKLVDRFITNPKYNDGKSEKTKHRDRSQRLTTALTGGNNPDKNPEFTWRRLIEGLVVLDVDMLTVSIETTRGKFNVKKVARATTSPKADCETYSRRKVTEYRPKETSKIIADYFIDTKKTATWQMEHVLLKVLWSIFNEYGLSKTMWETQAHRYVHDTNNCAQLQHRRNEKKNNLQRAITYRKSLTWNRFLETLKVIDVGEMTIVLSTQRNSAPIVENVFNINLKNLSFKTGGANE